MKKRILSTIIILLVLQLLIIQAVMASVDFSPELYEKLSDNVNKIPEIKVTEDYERIEMDNGMVVYLMEDHELPIIFMGGYIKGGRSQENEEMAGISDFMVDMMNTGTEKFGERELDYYKQINALSFGIDVSDNRYSFGGDALISEKDELLSLAAEILLNPNFKADYFGRIMNEWNKSLNQSLTQEGSLVNMFFYNNIFKNHPYSYSSNLILRLQNLNKINPEALIEHYTKNIVPDRTVFYVYGDIKTEEMMEEIEGKFADWTGTGLELKEPQVVIDEENFNRIILVDKPDATQARIKMGYNFYPEKYFESDLERKVAFEIGNQIYGGGDFESYLLKELRSEKGYAYNISADYFSSSLGGAYYVNTSIKPEAAYDTVESVKRIMGNLFIHQREFSDEEVFKIVNQWNAHIPLAYKYKDDLFTYIISNAENESRDKDYLNKYIETYNNLAAEEIQRVFTSNIWPDKFLTVIVGKKEDILPQFEENGIEVEVVNLF